MNAITADGQSADVFTAETTTSTVFTDLTTSGPAVTVSSLVNGQGCLVFLRARASHSVGGAGNAAYMGFTVSGSSTLAASDINSIESLLTTGQQITGFSINWFTASATGSHTFTCKYKVTSGTGTFAARRIVIKKF